jgi:isopenicillin N synthase-like dioxygenase
MGALVDWAELEVIDLAKVKTPEGKAEQVEKARDAMHRQGFFYAVNHGLDKSQVCSAKPCATTLATLTARRC